MTDPNAWIGPLDSDLNGDVLRIPVPPERWPYGPPEFHETICHLHTGGLYCDCAASDASDLDWGAGA